MSRIPRSVLHAVRDTAGLLLVTLVVGAALALWVVRTDPTWQHFVRDGLVSRWGSAGQLGWEHARAVAAPLLAVWLASRARVELRSAWTSAWLAVVLVILASVVAVVPLPGGAQLLGVWPGPADPLQLRPDGSWAVGVGPAWGFPVLTAGALMGAAVLGNRDGGRQDDGAAVRLLPLAAGGRMLAAAVVGIPATVATAGAVAALLVGSGWLTADRELATLAVALLAAALLSGTGPSGAVVTVLAALPVALVPLGSWFAGGSDVLLLQAAAGATACAAVAAWRPCVAWAAELVGTRDPRTTLPDAVDPLG
ncbi:MAG: hypothetical protein BGO38_11985 [Cellulomonas sp. 73-145]|uniref:hypothetical protein n=1 Tax=Cellulomonas sp. 73-145 TaxID=1895739 RepID=UPI000929A15C|nr:hypothetical protein [Cellulomonas sp. 73-145]MBN9325933.1 hypothetical protein [Cellulomonas sp.]OJV59543.1 MAG: hypothetical protein BGO38_11985 [Cellulomonas sp. 73-145]